jgi:hypothetical protein
MGTKYFLFGKEAINTLNQDGTEAVMRDDTISYRVAKFEKGASPEEVMTSAVGWGVFKAIDEEQYTMLNSHKDMFITHDGFCWKVINEEQARAILEHEIMDVFQLYGDNSEGNIEDMNDLNEAINAGRQLALEVGFVHYVKED